MKLRIRGNSLRLRLTKTEVAAVGAGRTVTESLSFGGGAPLAYALEPSSSVETLSARFEGNVVRVLVPRAQAVAWAAGPEVAIKTSASAVPFVLVEKDFQCLKPRQHEREDESDLYYNPNEVHGACR